MGKNDKNAWANKKVFDADELDVRIDALIKRYPFVSVVSIGQTTLGRAIPMISVGKGKKALLIVGGIAADESAGSLVLMRFLNEYCESIRTSAKVCGYNTAYLEHTRCIRIIPMLNADGIGYLNNGIDREGAVYQYLARIGKEEPDEKNWRGNARGIDLKSNFPNTYESSCLGEMEAESGALRNYLMFDREVRLVLTLSKGDPQVQYTYGEHRLPRLDPLGNALGEMFAAKYKRYDVSGSLGGFCTDELTVPSFDIRSNLDGDGFEDYVRLRKLLFVSQALI